MVKGQPMSMGQTIKVARKKRGWTQKQLFEQLRAHGLNYTSGSAIISLWENNESLPRLHAAEIIDKVLNTSIYDRILEEKTSGMVPPDTIGRNAIVDLARELFNRVVENGTSEQAHEALNHLMELQEATDAFSNYCWAVLDDLEEEAPEEED